MTDAEYEIDRIITRKQFIEYRMELAAANYEFAIKQATANRDAAYAIDLAELRSVLKERSDAEDAMQEAIQAEADAEEAALNAEQDEDGF